VLPPLPFSPPRQGEWAAIAAQRGADGLFPRDGLPHIPATSIDKTHFPSGVNILPEQFSKFDFPVILVFKAKPVKELIVPLVQPQVFGHQFKDALPESN